ncbi:hypothetical protein B6N60_02893 [Richelia sinica FACHB-800]|uniref:Uncharacterized protein n=1 Tax=Richelia sinica FACHB-800 TaxID=1357546 RepID=A0A975T8V8_9NOST|nr:hypothetical protein B6N60_02893 [Richelia sinica FACHB-800]
MIKNILRRILGGNFDTIIIQWLYKDISIMYDISVYPGVSLMVKHQS